MKKVLLVLAIVGIFLMPSSLEVKGVLPKEKKNLPYYLEGTIFDSNKTIVVTPDGQPPDDEIKFDYVLSYEEADRIRLEARERYIEKYGIDPWKKIDIAGPPKYLSDEEKLKLFKKLMDYPKEDDEFLSNYYNSDYLRDYSFLPLPLFSDLSLSYNFSSGNASYNFPKTMSTKQRHHPVLGGGDPRADFIVSDITPDVGETVYFDASCAQCHAWIDCYAWDFDYNTGDDAWGKTVTHTFYSPGLYTVKLWVRNGYDHSKTDRKLVDILVGGVSGDIKPVADFTISNKNPTVGETITFDASSTKNSESITCYAWDFDYNTGDDKWGRTVTHAYSSKGLHTAKLWVREGYDNSDADNILMDIPVHGAYWPFPTHEVDGRIQPKVFFARDSEHKPDPDEWIGVIKSVMTRFRDTFGVWPWEVIYYYNVWDASGTGTDSESQLDDLYYDLHYLYADDPYEFLIGVVKKSYHNGMACWDYKSCICADEATGGADWPHDSIVQHEVSHIFGADDMGWWPWEHPECIMNYYWAWSGTNKWCNDCKQDVMDGIWGR